MRKKIQLSFYSLYVSNILNDKSYYDFNGATFHFILASDEIKLFLINLYDPWLNQISSF
jgi:hypothetical protein